MKKIRKLLSKNEAVAFCVLPMKEASPIYILKIGDHEIAQFEDCVVSDEELKDLMKSAIAFFTLAEAIPISEEEANSLVYNSTPIFSDN
jgi:hypothetical protein